METMVRDKKPDKSGVGNEHKDQGREKQKVKAFFLDPGSTHSWLWQKHSSLSDSYSDW